MQRVSSVIFLSDPRVFISFYRIVSYNWHLLQIQDAMELNTHWPTHRHRPRREHRVPSAYKRSYEHRYIYVYIPNWSSRSATFSLMLESNLGKNDNSVSTNGMRTFYTCILPRLAGSGTTLFFFLKDAARELPRPYFIKRKKRTHL